VGAPSAFALLHTPVPTGKQQCKVLIYEFQPANGAVQRTIGTLEHAGFLFALKKVIDLASLMGLASKVQKMRKELPKRPKLANFSSRNGCNVRQAKIGITTSIVGKDYLV